jgi:hypothetical protein
MVFAVEGQCGQHTRENVSVTEQDLFVTSNARKGMTLDQVRPQCVDGPRGNSGLLGGA